MRNITRTFENVQIGSNGYVGINCNVDGGNVLFATCIHFGETSNNTGFNVCANGTVAFIFGNAGTVIDQCTVRIFYLIK